MNENLGKVQQRALQYWFVDGLAEMTAGGISLLLAAFGFWETIIVSRWAGLVFFAALFLAAFGLRFALNKLKERGTYPRTGYAAPLTGFENRRAALVTVAFVILLLGGNYYITTHGPESLLWSPALSGLVFAFIFGWTGYLTRLRRLYFVALFSLAAGIGLSLAGVSFFPAIAALCAAVGLIFLGLGIRTRRAYLRQNPSPEA